MNAPLPTASEEIMAKALNALVYRERPDDRPRCESFTSGIGSCWDDDRTAVPFTSRHMACPSCIAHLALTRAGFLR